MTERHDPPQQPQDNVEAAFEHRPFETGRNPAETLANAERASRERDLAIKQLLDKLPDGTVIDGWKKISTGGDTFWQKGRKAATFLHKEIGSDKARKALAEQKKHTTLHDDPPSRQSRRRDGNCIGSARTGTWPSRE